MGHLPRPVWLAMMLCALTFRGHGNRADQLAVWASSPAAPVQDGRPIMSPEHLLVHYCGTCHSKSRTGPDLDRLFEVSALQRDPATWYKVLQRLRSREMPPPDRPQPTPQEFDAMIQWIEKGLAGSDPADIGPLWVRLLQRTEYVNTIAYLLGVRVQLGDDFPKDQTVWSSTKKLPAVPADYLDVYRATATRVLEEVQSGPQTTQVVMNGQLAGAVAAPRMNPLFSQRSSSQSRSSWIRDNLARFARKAYRRPLESSEIDHLYSVYQRASRNGLPFEAAIKEPLREILSSRHFLYRVEYPGPKTLTRMSSRQQYALAARLSFTLWRSTPDSELLRQAEKGTLVKNLESQVRRLLRHRRSRAFSDEFASYWLGLESLGQAAGLDAPLHHLLRRETEEFVAYILQSERSLTEFIDADYTFVNDTLARHYDLPPVEGQHLRRVALQTRQRGGLLTQGSVLAITSYANDTSAVKRGKWILETFLGIQPPPPPPNLLRAFGESRRSFQPGTDRSRLETHRSNSACATCHQRIDPYGFALENYDMTGAWRTAQFDFPVDSSFELVDGTKLQGASGLKAHLQTQRGPFLQCLSDKLLSFALGTKSRPLDQAAIDRLTQKMNASQLTFTQLVVEVIKSDGFQRRKAS